MTMVTMTMMVVMLTLLLSPMVEQPSSNSSKWSERHFFANCLPVFLSPVSPVPEFYIELFELFNQRGLSFLLLSFEWICDLLKPFWLHSHVQQVLSELCLSLAFDQNQNHSKFMSGDTGQPITHGWRPAVGAFVTASYVICCQPFLFFFCHLLSPICKARKISPHPYQCCYFQYMCCCYSDWAEALKSVKCQQALPASRFNVEKEEKATMMHSKMHQQCNIWYKNCWWQSQ